MFFAVPIHRIPVRGRSRVKFSKQFFVPEDERSVIGSLRVEFVRSRIIFVVSMHRIDAQDSRKQNEEYFCECHISVLD